MQDRIDSHTSPAVALLATVAILAVAVTPYAMDVGKTDHQAAVSLGTAPLSRVRRPIPRGPCMREQHATAL